MSKMYLVYKSVLFTEKLIDFSMTHNAKYQKERAKEQAKRVKKAAQIAAWAWFIANKSGRISLRYRLSEYKRLQLI